MDYLKTAGRIFDIQRYSIHDGPGIRTIVFLKGCASCGADGAVIRNPRSLPFRTMIVQGEDEDHR